MARATNPFIDKILWASPSRTIGHYQWRAIVFTLPERYGRGVKRFDFQFCRASAFGSAPELWTDAQDFPGYARYLPHKGLPKQLASLRERYEESIDPVMGYVPQNKGAQLSFDLAV
jgi:hypothetical protein